MICKMFNLQMRRVMHGKCSAMMTVSSCLVTALTFIISDCCEMKDTGKPQLVSYRLFTVDTDLVWCSFKSHLQPLEYAEKQLLFSTILVTRGAPRQPLVRCTLSHIVTSILIECGAKLWEHFKPKPEVVHLMETSHTQKGACMTKMCAPFCNSKLWTQTFCSYEDFRYQLKSFNVNPENILFNS